NVFNLATSFWIAHALGLLALAPPLLALATPWLLRHGMATAPPSKQAPAGVPWPTRWGEAVEAGGLGLAAGGVGIALALTYAREPGQRHALPSVRRPHARRALQRPPARPRPPARSARRGGHPGQPGLQVDPRLGAGGADGGLPHLAGAHPPCRPGADARGPGP